MQLPGHISWNSFPTVQRWLNQLAASVKSCQIRSGIGYRVNRTQDGTSLVIDLKSLTSTTATRPPFTIYKTDTLKVKVTGGVVVWQEQQYTLAESAEITLPTSTTDYLFWLALDDEFVPTSVTITNGATGWLDYPDQPNPPARKFIQLGRATTDGTDITSITQDMSGNIVWVAIYGMWA